MPATADDTLIGLADEHFVLSHLPSAGFLAGPAPRGTRKVDIPVNSIDGGEPFLVQVKSPITGARNKWWLSQKHEEMREEDPFHCFVDFLPTQPDVYVLPVVTVADHVKKGQANWHATPRDDGGRHKGIKGRRIDNKALCTPLTFPF